MSIITKRMNEICEMLASYVVLHGSSPDINIVVDFPHFMNRLFKEGGHRL